MEPDVDALEFPQSPEDTQSAPNLVYTIAFDLPGRETFHRMAKLLVSSLLRTFFRGDIAVFTNSPKRLFMVERKGLHEIQVDGSFVAGITEESLEDRVRRFHAKTVEWMPVHEYSRVLYLDPWSLALRNIDHLLDVPTGDILYQIEKGVAKVSDGVFNREPPYSAYFTDEEVARQSRYGIHSGAWAVRGGMYEEVMALWASIMDRPPCRRRVKEGDHSAWNRLIIDCGLAVRRFERGEVQFPLGIQRDFACYSDAALLNFSGGTSEQRIRLMYAMFMTTFFYDPSFIFFNCLET